MQPSYPTTPPGSRFWRVVHFPLVTLIIGMIAVIAPSTLLQVVADRLLGITPRIATPGTALAITVLAVLAGIAGYLAFNRWVERRGNVEFARADAARELGAGLVAGVVLFSAIVGVIALFGGYHIVGHNRAEVLVRVLALSIGSGFTEELLVRGLIFRLLEQWLGSWVALAISAALFGAAHLANPNASLFAAVCIAVEAGVMLGAMYMLTRRLWAAIGLHAAWNFTQGGIYGIPVSGLPTDGLLRDRPGGPALLTGGAFGAEASLPALVLATAFGVALLAACLKHDRVVPFLPGRRAG